jgi:hypothetical protein
MDFVIIIIIAAAVIIYAARFIKSAPSASKVISIPESNTPIDLTALEQVCMEAGDPEEHDIDFWLVSDSVHDTIATRGPATAWLNKNPPARIVYTDKEGNKTIRDITPLRINGSPGWDFGINAYCHLRKGSRDFRVSKISAAWCQGKEINLGDYLAELCKKTPEYKSAVRKTGKKRPSADPAGEALKE